MGENPLAKNAPSVQPFAKILSKIDLGFACYGIILVGTIVTVFASSPSTIRRYAAENPGQDDLQLFLDFDPEKQWTILGTYFGWYWLELIIALLFFFGARNRSYTILKIWLIVTIINCIAGLLSAVPVYLFTANKTLFVTFALIIYMYKLLCIYIVDLFLREIVVKSGEKRYDL